MKRRTFSREFKIEAVKLVTECGVAVAQAWRELELSESVLRLWMRELEDAPVGACPGNGRPNAEQAELVALKKEVARLKAERDILKNGDRVLREGRDMRFAFIAKHRHVWPVSWLCAALGVSRSGFHAWLNRPLSARAASDEKLGSAMRKSFKDSDRTYGARRIWRDVLEEGLACGLHRIERLMRANGLMARPRRRGRPKDDGERSVIADNVLDRDFRAGQAEPEVAGGLHLHLDGRGLALRRHRPGPVLTPDRRLVDEGGTRHSARHGCPHDGRMEARKGGRVSASLRPGPPVRI